MNLNQLETLVAISKTMSFRKAAELLNLTQPAVSAQIKSLEEQFQTTLIDRNQPVTLTDSGKIFLEHAHKILQEIQVLKERLMDLKEIPQGHIRLGTTTPIAMQILPRVLSYFQNQFPRIQTSIHSMPSSQIMESLESGFIDIGITYLFERNESFDTSVLYYDMFKLVVSPEHPMAHYDQITIDQLQQLPMIMLAPDTAGRRFTDQIFAKFNIQPKTIMELSSSEEVKRMVELNLGAAIISQSSIARELKAGTLQVVNVQELEIYHPVGVLVKADRYLNSALQQFLNDLKGMPESKFIGT